jgi:hypothetical protein
MGMTLDYILAEAKDGAHVRMTMVSNEEDGICAYATGLLKFSAATGGQVLGGPRRRPAHMESIRSEATKFYVSNRMLSIDPPPPADTFGPGPRQPFNANDTEPSFALSLTFGDAPTVPVTLSLFGGKSKLDMEKRGKLLAGVGPSLGPSEGGMYVISFTELIQPPR